MAVSPRKLFRRTVVGRKEFLPIEAGLRDFRIIRDRRTRRQTIAIVLGGTSVTARQQTIDKLLLLQLVLGIIEARNLCRSADGRMLLAWHPELHAAARSHRIVGEALQLAVALRVHAKELQVALRVEVALPAVRCVVAQSLRRRDHVRLDGDQHLLLERYAEVMLGHLRHLAGRVEQHLEALHGTAANVLEMLPEEEQHDEHADTGARPEHAERIHVRIDRLRVGVAVLHRPTVRGEIVIVAAEIVAYAGNMKYKRIAHFRITLSPCEK